MAVLILFQALLTPATVVDGTVEYASEVTSCMTRYMSGMVDSLMYGIICMADGLVYGINGIPGNLYCFSSK